MNRRILRRWKSNAMVALMIGAVILALAPLFFILFDLVIRGASSLNLDFFTRTPAPIGQTGGGQAYWVGEGKPKPLTAFDFSRTPLDELKVATITVVTEELLRNQARETIARRKSEEEWERFLRQARAESYVDLRLSSEAMLGALASSR